MPHSFRIVNVFTVDGAPLSGNPLCVFEDARGLTTERMQALARQLNLSETTFVLPPTDPETAAARVRIFTPTFEMPFAGHPTLGTAAVIAAGRARVTLEMIAGLVPVTCAGASYTLRAAQAPVTRPAAARADLARMLGLPADAIADEPLWVSTGVEQLVIPLTTAAHVAAARPAPELLERWGYGTTRDEAMAYVWAPPAEPDGAWPVRFFFTAGGAVIEDPATGSACANLGGWLVARGRPLPLTASLTQGTAVGRPSRLGLRVDADRHIHVTGEVIEVARGAFDL